MRKSLQTLGLSMFIVLALLVIGIGFLFGIDNPVPWIMIAVLALLPVVHKKMVQRRFVRWDDSLSVGIEMIDQDHKKLIDLINNLQQAVYYPTGEAFEKQALEELLDYTKYHFQREEQMLQENGYPEFDEHKAQHEKMIGKVGAVMARYEKEPEETIEELCLYLRRWLLEHIAGTDQRYGPYLNERGLS